MINVSGSSILIAKKIILGGDLNFTLSIREVWGASSRRDYQGIFFSHWMDNNHLFEMEPTNLVQIWKNDTKGKDLVAKITDIILILEEMIENMWSFKLRLVVGGISDHMPILLEIDTKGSKTPSLMNFNHVWLNEKEYERLVWKTWTHMDEEDGQSYMHRFAVNIVKIKKGHIIMGQIFQYEISHSVLGHGI
jgi:hypothetical protein